MQSVENFAITAVGSLEEAGPGRKTDEEFANEYHLPNYPDPLATQAQLTGLPKDITASEGNTKLPAAITNVGLRVAGPGSSAATYVLETLTMASAKASSNGKVLDMFERRE